MVEDIGAPLGMLVTTKGTQTARFGERKLRTTVYAFMQAMGLVNDHLDGCDARPSAQAARAEFTSPSHGRKLL